MSLPVVFVAGLSLFYISFASAAIQCPQGSVVTFVRISRAKLTGNTAVMTSAGDDVTCAQYCANNLEPTSGAPTSCAAFNWDGRQNCQFYDNAATPSGSGILAPNPGANHFYYEKVCLPAVTPHQACTYRSYSFERLRGMHLSGFVKKSIQAGDRETCLSACLAETEFVCKSVNYNYNTQFCELSDQDRRSKPQYMQTSTTDPTDYFDNNCLSRQNRCGPVGGNLIFVRTTNFELHGYDHSTSVEAGESYCLQKCLDSSSTFCRSAEFSPTHNKCSVSDEDTYSRADMQGDPQFESKDYYEPICVASDLTSSNCRQQAAFTRVIGHKIEGQSISTTPQVTIADCISLCFQNLHCGSINYDRTSLTCNVFAGSRQNGQVTADPSVDYYEFHCDSQFGGMAVCTDEGIKFVVNTKEPYTGAVYAAENFASCNQVVTNSKQITMMFPPPTHSSMCGTSLHNGKLVANVVVSLDGVLPHQVTTEWDRFYKVTCDTTLQGMGEGSVVVTTLFDSELQDAQIVPAATPGPATAVLAFVDSYNNPVSQAYIGDDIYLVTSSPQSGPGNMAVLDCTANQGSTRNSAASVPFKVVDNGCPTYPALVGPVTQDFAQNRLAAKMKAFRLDGSYDVQISCTVMFCAGPQGCPPSNCLDSAFNNLFQSYGRKRRSLAPNETEVKTTEEHLSASIRVLAQGEENLERSEKTEVKMKKVEKMANLVLEELWNGGGEELLCLAEPSFIGIIVTVSLLCLLFSVVLIFWGCSKLRPTATSISHAKTDSSLYSRSTQPTANSQISSALQVIPVMTTPTP